MAYANQTSAKTDHDIIIVGLGPTGATLANILGGYGLDVLVLEREASVYPLPRAVHFDDEALRVFQSIGLAEKIESKARVNLGTRFVDKDQNLVLDWPRPQQIGPLGWYPSYRFHQPDLENDLNDGLAAHPSVTVKRDTEVTKVQNRGDHAAVNFVHNGTKDSATAAYVVGTDGARSVVRAAIDCDWEDLGFQERWLVIDVLLKRECAHLGNFTIQTCDIDRPTTYVRCPGDRRRWEISLKAHESDAMAIEDDFIWPKLRPGITGEDGTIERRAVYNFESKLAGNWRRERCFIAGDAAHLMPPFLGQGMCAGIRDAANLGWKLAAVMLWGAPDALLDSYESERRPHTRTYIETAVNVGKMMNSAETAETLTHAIRPDGGAHMNSINRGLGPGLVPANASRVGERMPQPGLADGTRLSDAMQGRFAVIAPDDLIASAADKMPDETVAVAISADSNPELAAMLAEMDAAGLVLRPDFYSYGMLSSDNSANLPDLLPDLFADLLAELGAHVTAA